MEAEHGYKFGPYKIDSSEVFYSTALSFAMVNLRPVVPVASGGNVLLRGPRPCSRFLLGDNFLMLGNAASKILSHYTKGLYISGAILQARPPKDYRCLDFWDEKYFQEREVKRFADLTADETSDLWFAAKEVGVHLESHHKASSLTFTIQDGPQAGQTVPHVHIHILPRKIGDFQNNDEIYDAIDVKESQLKDKLDLDKERKDRTPDEMSREADEYRALFS